MKTDPAWLLATLKEAYQAHTPAMWEKLNKKLEDAGIIGNDPLLRKKPTNKKTKDNVPEHTQRSASTDYALGSQSQD